MSNQCIRSKCSRLYSFGICISAILYLTGHATSCSAVGEPSLKVWEYTQSGDWKEVRIPEGTPRSVSDATPLRVQLSDLGTSDIDRLRIIHGSITECFLVGNVTENSKIGKILSSFHNLKQLWCVSGRLSNELITVIPQLTQLEYLSLSYPRLGQNNMPNLDLTNLIGLKDLSLDGVPMSKSILRSIIKCASLEGLHLDQTNLDNIGMEKLSNLEGLQSLSVAANQIGNLDSGILERFVNLSALNLSFTQITDRDLSAIGRLEQMRHLYLNDTPVSDRGIEYLSGLDLESIGLSGTNVTASSLRSLSMMKSLNRIELSRTSITKGSLSLLQNRSVAFLYMASQVIAHD